MDNKTVTTGRKSKYAAKKNRQGNGSYVGPSPFFNNNPEWQFLKPLKAYAHLAKYNLPWEGGKKQSYDNTTDDID